ncbi:hypothetical protein AYI68_g7207, partial [Smittium mucronatum]
MFSTSVGGLSLGSGVNGYIVDRGIGCAWKCIASSSSNLCASSLANCSRFLSAYISVLNSNGTGFVTSSFAFGFVVQFPPNFATFLAYASARPGVLGFEKEEFSESEWLFVFCFSKLELETSDGLFLDSSLPSAPELSLFRLFRTSVLNLSWTGTVSFDDFCFFDLLWPLLFPLIAFSSSGSNPRFLLFFANGLILFTVSSRCINELVVVLPIGDFELIKSNSKRSLNASFSAL